MPVLTSPGYYLTQKFADSAASLPRFLLKKSERNRENTFKICLNGFILHGIDFAIGFVQKRQDETAALKVWWILFHVPFQNFKVF